MFKEAKAKIRSKNNKKTGIQICIVFKKGIKSSYIINIGFKQVSKPKDNYNTYNLTEYGEGKIFCTLIKI